VAAIESATNKNKWVEVSSNYNMDKMKVLDAKNTPWSENLNYYNPYIKDELMAVKLTDF